MVAANKNLLRLVRQLAVKDELLAMRLRGQLVVMVVADRHSQTNKPTQPEDHK